MYFAFVFVLVIIFSLSASYGAGTIISPPGSTSIDSTTSVDQKSTTDDEDFEVPPDLGYHCYFGSTSCTGTRVFSSYHVCCNSGEVCTYYDYSPVGLLPVCLPECIEPNTRCYGEWLFNMYWDCCAPDGCEVNPGNGRPYCTNVLPSGPCAAGTFQCNGTMAENYVCCPGEISDCGLKPIGGGVMQAECVEKNCSLRGLERCANLSDPAWGNYSVCCNPGNCTINNETGEPMCLDHLGGGECSIMYSPDSGDLYEISSCDHYNYIDGSQEEKRQQCLTDCKNVSRFDAENYFTFSYNYSVNAYKCDWDYQNGACYFWYNVSHRGSSPEYAECQLIHSSIIECGEDDEVYNSPYIVFNLSGMLETCSRVTCGDQECERFLMCPRQVQLPFFDEVNFVLVAFIIIGVYFVGVRRFKN